MNGAVPSPIRPMAKYKILRAAAHNFAESFFGLLNSSGGPPIIEWFAWIAMRKGLRTAEIEFLSGRIEPEAFQIPNIVEAVRRYRELLPDFLRRNGCPIKHVRRVTVRLRVDEHMLHMGELRVRYSRESEIEDERGKVWLAGPVRGSTHLTCVENELSGRGENRAGQPDVLGA